ncbi:MAG: nuclear transport factor 2 family protein [Saprospiraceae bacterium]|uniref:Nuclear transport factor 2 family protein n=1 Tax=Candidatus Opimibacter skivensis TaxID=2982028 RepID=A0A9D7T2P8_9BACT|nr:nuclear transport factor 2 family protein [Candidatus Opimibacter skivensis]
MTSKIQTVQQCYAEFGKGNPQGVLDLLTDDVTWTDPGYPEIPYAGKCKGKSEVLHFFTEMGKTISFTHFEPQQFMNDGNNVIVKGFFIGKSNHTGKTFESEWMMIWEVENEKVKTYQAFIDTFKVVAALK